MANEKLKKMVGDHSHKECSNSSCKGYKKGKQEHIFVEKGYFLAPNDYGWECKSCGRYTKVG